MVASSRAATDSDARVQERQQRGLNSFLTWPFFLAQMFAAQLLDAGNASARVDEPQLQSARSALADDASDAERVNDAGWILAGSDPEVDQSLATRAASLDTPRLALEDEPVTTPSEQAREAKGNDAKAGSVTAGGGEAGDAAADAGSAQAADVAAADDADISTPAIFQSVQPALTLAELFPELGDPDPFADAFENAQPLPDAQTDATVTTADLTDSVLGSAQPLIQAVSPALADVAGLVGDALGTGPVEPAMTALTTPIDTAISLTDAVAEVAGTTGLVADDVQTALSTTLVSAAELTNQLPLELTVETVQPVLNATADKVADLVGDLLHVAPPTFETAASVFSATENSIAELASDPGAEPLGAAAQLALSVATNNVADVTEAAGEAIAPATDTVNLATDAIKSVFSTAAKIASDATGDVLEPPHGPPASSAEQALADLSDPGAEPLGGAVQLAHSAATNNSADLAEGAGEAIAPVTDTVDLATDATKSVFSTAAKVASDATGDGLEPANVPPASSAEQSLADTGDAISELRTSDVVASGGVIASFQEPSSDSASDSSHDDLFSGGRFTDYGLALNVQSEAEPQSGSAAEAGTHPAHASPDPGSKSDHDPTGDAAHADPVQAITTSLTANAATSLEDLEVRGDHGLL
jgi:hypothetical protein